MSSFAATACPRLGRCAANKARIPRLAAFDDTLQPFERAVWPKKVSKAQCLVAPPLQVRGGCERSIVDLNNIGLVPRHGLQPLFHGALNGPGAFRQVLRRILVLHCYRPFVSPRVAR